MYRFNKSLKFGMSMLEVLIAFTVLIVGVGAIIGFYGYIMHSTVGKTQREVCKSVAVNVLDYLSYYIPNKLTASEIQTLKSSSYTTPVNAYFFDVKKAGDFSLYGPDDLSGSVVIKYPGSTPPASPWLLKDISYPGGSATTCSYAMAIYTTSIPGIDNAILVKVRTSYKFPRSVKVGSGVYNVPPAVFSVETVVPLDFK